MEDLRAVARADVVALAVLGAGVVDLEEELQDVPVGDPLRVEDDLDGLGVAGVVAVRRVRVLASGVSDAGRDDAVALAEQLLHAPEAASGEDCGLGLVGQGVAPSVGSRLSLKPSLPRAGGVTARRCGTARRAVPGRAAAASGRGSPGSAAETAAAEACGWTRTAPWPGPPA